MATTKKKKSIVDSLSRSIEEEEKTIDRRFEKADEYFNKDFKESIPGASMKGRHEGRTEKQPSKPEPRVMIEKVIRDGFSMPVSDQKLIQDIRTKSIKLGVETNKSEIVRAGLRALMDLPDAKLAGLLKSIPKIKTGRPVEK